MLYSTLKAEIQNDRLLSNLRLANSKISEENQLVHIQSQIKKKSTKPQRRQSQQLLLELSKNKIQIVQDSEHVNDCKFLVRSDEDDDQAVDHIYQQIFRVDESSQPPPIRHIVDGGHQNYLSPILQLLVSLPELTTLIMAQHSQKKHPFIRCMKSLLKDLNKQRLKHMELASSSESIVSMHDVAQTPNSDETISEPDLMFRSILTHIYNDLKPVCQQQLHSLFKPDLAALYVCKNCSHQWRVRLDATSVIELRPYFDLQDSVDQFFNPSAVRMSCIKCVNKPIDQKKQRCTKQIKTQLGSKLLCFKIS